MDNEDRIWRSRVIDECTRDIERGLDHALSNAPGRVRLAQDALERLCKAVLRCPDEVLVDLHAKLAEAEKRYEALEQAARVVAERTVTPAHGEHSGWLYAHTDEIAALRAALMESG